MPKLVTLISLLMFSTYGLCVEPVRVSLKEVYNPNVTVSGQVRSGVMYKSARNNKISIPPTLVINLGAEEHGNLCGKLISSDGKYEASFNEALPTTNKLAQRSGAVRIEFASVHGEQLDDYRYDQIALLWYEGSDDCKKIKHFFPASWTNTKADQLIIYLNAGQFNAKLLVYRKDPSLKKPGVVQCKQIEGNRQVAFDTLCEIDLGMYADFNLAKTKIKRSNGQNFAKPIKLPIGGISEIQ